MSIRWSIGPLVHWSVGSLVRWSMVIKLKSDETSFLKYFTSVCVCGNRGRVVDGGWMPLPSRPQPYCDPASLVEMYINITFGDCPGITRLSNLTLNNPLAWFKRQLVSSLIIVPFGSTLRHDFQLLAIAYSFLINGKTRIQISSCHLLDSLRTDGLTDRLTWRSSCSLIARD